MDDMQQAHHELDYLQRIITRHEGHMFALRGWLLMIIGGLLAAYYTANIDMSALMLRAALLVITLLFFIIESRHVNLIEAVVERVTSIEKQITSLSPRESQPVDGWYDGPKISETCLEGASRWWPQNGMTFILNLPFYIAVILVVIITTVSLPPKQEVTQASVPTAQPAQK